MSVLFPKMEISSGRDNKARLLRHRLIMPPFSVFDARQGYWQNRKKAWISMGIESELGRGENLLISDERLTTENLNHYRNKESGKFKGANAFDVGGINKYGKPKVVKKGSLLGQKPIHAYDKGGAASQAGTSIFDPVLCEIIYSWFCPAGGTVLDPFAGGSVRGIVANYLGLHYTGIELSRPQVEANRMQAEKIIPDNMPTWFQGDSSKMDHILNADSEFDFIFSCPPYYDLEVYSNDPTDLSTMSYSEFRKLYFYIIARAVCRLKEDRFACFVVGEIRDKKTGFYRSFVPHTIRAFETAGAQFYNEAILLTQIGSLPIRTNMYYKTRKLGKAHQNVLIFYKGDPTKIKDNFGGGVEDV